MRIGAAEAGFLGAGLIGLIFQIVITVAQLYALFLFVKAAKIYIRNNQEYDESVSDNTHDIGWS